MDVCRPWCPARKSVRQSRLLFLVLGSVGEGPATTSARVSDDLDGFVTLIIYTDRIVFGDPGLRRHTLSSHGREVIEQERVSRRSSIVNSLVLSCTVRGSRGEDVRPIKISRVWGGHNVG